MVLYTHDTKIHETHEVKNGNIDKIMKLKISGGGGTSHIELIEKLNENNDFKVVVFLTDGYSDLNEIDFNKNKFVLVTNDHNKADY